MARFYLLRNMDEEQGELKKIVEELGSTKYDTNRWFADMAREYRWPQGSRGWRLTSDFEQISVVGDIII